MLNALSIRDLVLIDRLDLSLEAGFTALTGETGAGKSIILDGLGLALGGRADRSLVRAGADRASALAVFSVTDDHTARGLLDAAGLDPCLGEDLVLRRVLSVDGKSKAFINDQAVSASFLSEIGATLVEIHGQRATHGLLSPAGHRRMLDEFGGLQKDAARCALAYDLLKGAQDRVDALLLAKDTAARDLDYLRHATAELVAFDPAEGEEDALNAERALLANGAKLTDDLLTIDEMMARETGAEAALGGALRKIERLQRTLANKGGATSPTIALAGVLSACQDSLSMALDAAADARARIEQALHSVSSKPGRLEAIDDRLHDMRALARKHQCRPAELAGLRLQFEARLGSCTAVVVDLADAQANLEKCRTAFQAAANDLSAKRHKVAAKLDKAVQCELAPLKLDKARFQTGISALEAPSPQGLDSIVFQIAANPGAPFGPLQTAASGGELARIALAIKAALAKSSGPSLLVFDEIDQGVGGAVADAVGTRLGRLAKSAQVLAITHSPQVAARADQQWQVEKSMVGAQMRTRVVPLSAEGRDEELARMLSGANVTAAARKAAKALRAA